VTMSNARTNLGYILTELFKDPVNEKKHITQNHQNISKGYISRCFDDFPALLLPNTLNKFNIDFINLIRNVNPNDVAITDNNGYLLLNKKDKLAVMKFQRELINIALGELICFDGS